MLRMRFCGLARIHASFLSSKFDNALCVISEDANILTFVPFFLDIQHSYFSEEIYKKKSTIRYSCMENKT